MTKKIILIVAILLLAGAAFVWFSNTANTKQMTEPIQKQLSNRSGATFEIVETEYLKDHGTAIVTITDAQGGVTTEKYFMQKNDGVWVIDRTETHTSTSK